MRYATELPYLLIGSLVLLATFFAGAIEVQAGCSPYIGLATLNEVHVHNQSDNSGPYYVEVKALDNSILSSVPPLWQNWTMDICSEAGALDGLPCRNDIPIIDGFLQNSWLVINQDVIQWNYLDLNDGNKHGMEIILYDENHEIVDYLSVDNYSVTGHSGCSFPYDTSYGGGNNFNLQREPDGVGDWDSSGSGGSGEETANDTNDPVPPASPYLSVGDATGAAGQSMVFTLQLSAASASDIVIEYRTQDGTATAGSDYSSASGTVTIPAGSITVEISIPTISSATPGSYFFLVLDEVTSSNAAILNNLARGTFCLACGDIDHVRIEHSGTGLTCQRTNVKVRACIDATCSIEADYAVALDLLPANANPPIWIGGDSISFTGNITVQLRQTAAATLSLGASNISTAPVNGVKCFDSGVEGDCEIEFFESGFLFDVPDLTACQTSPAVSVQAVRMDDQTQRCVADAGFANTSKTINFWSTYSNPNAGTEPVAISGTNIATGSPGTGISLNFNAAATASFTVNYPDSGQLQLDARYAGSGGEESGLVMLGSDSFVSRPVGLCVYSDEVSADCLGGNSTCSVHRKVDELFTLKIKAVCWETAGDTDFCSGNSTTPNYEQNGVPISHTLIAPTSLGSSAGSIGVGVFDVIDADNGEHVIGNQTVSEVGVFTFTVTPPDYFGGALPPATSANIGRFTPDHFVTNITSHGTLENGCTGFTYTGQSFGYDPLDRPEMAITATGSGGNTTVNYRDGFVKLIDPATQISMPAVTADSTTLGADAVTPLALSWSPGPSNLVANDDGTLFFTLGADDFSYPRNANALVAPFNTDIQLEVASIADSDGIVADDLARFFSPSTIEIRYGQLLMQNAYGPETLPLALSLSAQYFNGTGFVNNNLDSCTPYDAVNLGLSNWQGNLSSGDTVASSATGLQLNTGLGTGMSLSAPGTGNDGSVDFTLDLSSATGLDLEWLRPAGIDPTAKATFGIYGGNQRLIYMRESVQ